MRDDVRDLIAPALPPVSDTDLAWETIQGRVARRHRRRGLFVGAAMAAGTAVAMALVVVVASGPREPSLPPDVGSTASPDPTPTDRSVSLPDCVDGSVPEAIREFVADWTTGEQLEVADQPDLCLLEGRTGPAPAFDTTALGQERPLAPGDTAGEMQPPLLPAGAGELDGYPAVHLGRLDGSEYHAMMTWWLKPERSGVMLCLESACQFDGLVPPEELTIVSTATGGGSVGVTTWAPAQAAAVGVTVEGQAQVWQRPVARTAQIQFDPSPGEIDFESPQAPTTFVVTAYAADGEVLDQVTGSIE